MNLPALHALISSDWLVEPASHALFVAEAAAEMTALASGKIVPAARDNGEGAIGGSSKLPKLAVENGVGIITVSGPMMRRPDEYQLRRGAAPTDHLTGLAREALARPDVRSVLLRFDTPGGQVSGTAEFADAVGALAAAKPTVAFTDSLLASAGYWVASQTGMIVATPSAQIGSIGVYGALIDMKGLFDKFGLKMEVFRNEAADLKTIGLPGTSVTESQRAHMQDRMEEIFQEFAGAVTAMRPGVKPESMRGQVFAARPALASGLVDKIGSEADALALITRR